MHDLCHELDLICKHIPYIKGENEKHEKAIVFKVGKMIGKVEFLESDYVEEAYDRLKVSIIHPEVGTIDHIEIEFRYILDSECYLKIDELSADWHTSRKICRELSEDDYKLIAEVALSYLKEFDY